MIRSIGFLVLSVGGYFLWRNRFEIQRVLERYGVDTPLDNSSIGNTVKSGLSKAVGTVEHGIRNLDTTSTLNKTRTG